MKPIPVTDNSLVIRTDFADEAAWEAIIEAVQQPVGDFPYFADVVFLADADFDGLDKDQLRGLVPEGFPHSYLVVADRVAIASAEHPLLVVDLQDEPGREFRAIPSTVQDIAVNLSISNMDFEDFVVGVGEDGIFRGYD